MCLLPLQLPNLQALEIINRRITLSIPFNILKDFGVSTIFRFILTHPDMDHMDGMKSLFDSFSILNFWDTANTKVIDPQ